MTVFTSKFPNSARDVVVSCTVPEEKSCGGSEKWRDCECTCALPPRLVLFLASVTEATALAAVAHAGPESPHTSLTWEELSSSAACEDVERVSSDWPRDPTLARLFSNLPLPLLCGGDESDSQATAPSSPDDEPDGRSNSDTSSGTSSLHSRWWRPAGGTRNTSGEECTQTNTFRRKKKKQAVHRHFHNMAARLEGLPVCYFNSPPAGKFASTKTRVPNPRREFPRLGSG
ncbi:hypothetical protein EYF80_037938 [Liparis tanakae]|uniref:Uncharacterized protein n=1 Tax=Liparis tanakae TaxID=230148 RepID=A0A4Z2GGP5_9TELE|nr:hypothetical protein EYF80_037938 [Liparis tanakae]